jgi:hypothetical protein
MNEKPFAPEIGIYQLVARMLVFIEDLMESHIWAMSPSRAYSSLREVIRWFRDNNIWHFRQPAFLYVMEQLEARARALDGTSKDEDFAMEMTMWRDRKRPIPGGVKSVLQVFDWFMPIFRAMERKMIEYYGNPDYSAGGKEFTKYEAVDIAFNAVDKLYKDQRFGKYNSWGQPEAYPWVKFVREEIFEWREALRPSAPAPAPGYEPPFSVG